MIDIHYKKFKFYFSDLGAEDAYQFYKNGECDSCILDEHYALKNYPIDQYNWIEIKEKQDITYFSYECDFDDIGRTTVYNFYPFGVWDDDVLLLADALKKYPTDKYNWIEIKDDVT